MKTKTYGIKFDKIAGKQYTDNGPSNHLKLLRRRSIGAAQLKLGKDATMVTWPRGQSKNG
eukprot:1654184-Pyramimonas_sp.AAC.1